MPTDLKAEGKYNQVIVTPHEVTKTFAGGQGKAARFKREREALRRMAGVDGVPELLAHDTRDQRLVTTYIPGTPLTDAENAPDAAFQQLREIVQTMLDCGVARHSLPPRDVLVQTNGEVGLVDFERVSLRHLPFSPVWWVARQVTEFNLLRLIDAHAPHLLDSQEREQMERQYQLHNRFHHWRKRLRP